MVLKKGVTVQFRLCSNTGVKNISALEDAEKGHPSGELSDKIHQTKVDMQRRKRRQFKKGITMGINKGIMILFVLTVFSCRTNSNSINFPTIPKQKIEVRDSLFILFTLKSFYENDWDSFRDDSKFYKIDTTKIRYSIDRVFYSPDRKKIFIWTVRKSPNGPSITIYKADKTANYLCQKSDDMFYDITALIGFRESINSTWNIYPFTNLIVSCSKSISEGDQLFCKYYFEQMKDNSESVNKKFLDKNYGGEVRYDIEDETVKDGYGDKNYQLIFKNYGYNLQDKDFWNRSLIWQKGARIPGLYNFQTTGNVTPDEGNVEMVLPNIKYPDSFLKLYK
jgi:hypothetical protein